MEADREGREQMLADDWQWESREFTVWAWLESTYHHLAMILIKQGVPLSRDGFLSAVGVPLFTPKGIAQLVHLGVDVVGFQVTMAGQAPPPDRSILNGGPRR